MCQELTSILDKFFVLTVCLTAVLSAEPTGGRSHDAAAAAQPWIRRPTLNRQPLPVSSSRSARLWLVIIETVVVETLSANLKRQLTLTTTDGLSSLPKARLFSQDLEKQVGQK